MFSCSKATNEVNYLAQKFVRPRSARTTSTPATALDTPLPSSVWRQSSERAAARRPTERTRKRIVIVLWGSNARETHPIFFHHVLKAVHDGARCSSSIPRRTGSAQWADTLARPRRRAPTSPSRTRSPARSSTRGLANERSSSGRRRASTSTAPRSSRGRWSEGEKVTGVPAETIRDLAHAYARADRAQLCWTLGITEHHNGGRQRAVADQPRAAHRPRRPVRRAA